MGKIWPKLFSSLPIHVIQIRNLEDFRISNLKKFSETDENWWIPN